MLCSAKDCSKSQDGVFGSLWPGNAVWELQHQSTWKEWKIRDSVSADENCM